MSPWQLVVLGVLALGTAALLVWRQPAWAFAQRSATFLREVRGEVRKISWPSWDDLRRSTLVITIFVVVIGLVIGIMDSVFSLILIRWLGQVFG